MNPERRSPAWNILYLMIALVLIGALVIFNRAASENQRWWDELLTIVVVFGLVWIWLRANDAPIMRDEQRRFGPIEPEHRREKETARGLIGFLSSLFHL